MLFDNIINVIDGTLARFTFDGYQNLVSHYEPAIFSMMVLFVVFWGYKLMIGKVELSSSDVLTKLLMLGTCYFVATNFGFFSKVIYDFATNAPSQLSSVILSGQTESSLTGVQMLNEVWDMGKNMAVNLNKSHALNPLLILYSATVMGIASLVAAMGLLYITASKLFLSVGLVLTPLFVMLYIYEPTRGLFNGWLQSVTTAMIMPIIIYCIIGLDYAIVKALSSDFANSDQVGMVDVATYMILSIMSGGLFIIAGQLAARIGGGIHFGISHAANHTKQWSAMVSKMAFRTIPKLKIGAK